MSRKNRSPEEKARRAKIRELLQMANIDSMDDIQDLFKETIAEFMENGLEAELDEDLGYSKYDYKNKATDNSRNGHSSNEHESQRSNGWRLCRNLLLPTSFFLPLWLRHPTPMGMLQKM